METALLASGSADGAMTDDGVPAPAPPSNGHGGHVEAATMDALRQHAAAERIDPPQAWPQDIRARHWESLPPELRRFISMREAEAHRMISEQGGRLKQFEPIRSVFDQWRQHVPELEQMAPHDAVNHMLAAHHMLASRPQEAMQWLAQQYGIDPLSLLAPQHRSQLAGFHHASQRMQALEAELAELKATAQHEAEQRKQHATAARRAAAINIGAGASAPVRTTPQTIDDTLRGIARRRFRLTGEPGAAALTRRR